MALAGVLVEAHSYSGGLRHTPFPGGGARPAWAPPADSVGWRDDFELGDQDVVVEFHQRAFEGETVSWLAVYYPSTDARFGDRRNHAGVGLWARAKRIADARSLLLALDQLSAALARNPDPEALQPEVELFVSDRYLGAYLLPADALPRDWSGAPASSATLVDTSYRHVRAASLSVAVDRIAEQVARLSLGWANPGATPRTLILVTPRPVDPAERAFVELDPPGGFLADLLERLPYAFEQDRRLLREEADGLSRARTAWEEERRAQQALWDAERREWQQLDRHPATLEGIASRLNGLSRQLTELRGSIGDAPEPRKRTPTATVAVKEPRPPATTGEAAKELEPIPASSWAILGGLALFLVIVVLILIRVARPSS